LREMQLIYASRPFGFDDLMLTSILSTSRRNNERDGITGALVCREDLFLQMLEGKRDVVTSAFSRILRDDRHVEVANLWSGDIETRLFPEWSMRHDPARSWMWTMAEVAKGAVGGASMHEIRNVFDRLAKEPPHLNRN
jgi:Sensors of blue-light using FAD